ncbi:MAG: Amuc_1102 family pilus-like protein [Verrucomicrobiota bacterium]
MKIPAFAFAALSLAASGAAFGAPTIPAAAITSKNVKIEKIQPAVVPTPDFVLKSAESKRSQPQKWLEIEVEFAVEGVEIVDELTFKFDVLLNGKLCPGEITHINIPKGRDRYTIMYVSPRNLERISDGHPLTPAMIQNAWVTILRQGQVLAVSAMKDKTKPVPNMPLTPGMLSPKADTPFAPLWSDRYEAVKPTNR